MSGPHMETLKRIHAERRARWQALGVWGRLKFRVARRYAMARYRIAGAWEILRHGDEDEYWNLPSLDKDTTQQPRTP